MKTNFVICRNEVIIEGVNVGRFESFEYQANNRTLGNTAVLTIPLYALGVVQGGVARSRMRSVFITSNEGKRVNVIRPCAQVEVRCWYEGMGRIRVFTGFIEHVAEGFPAKLYLQDNAFILRFGSIQKGWDGNATVQSIINDCIPIAQDAFNKEREKAGFTREIPPIRYSTEGQQVQAETTALSFKNWGARSPFDTIQKLMQQLMMYGGVSDDFNVYVGAGVKESNRPIIALDTRYNVIERNVVPVDGRFVDYDVKVTGILADGKQFAATGGEGSRRARAERSEFERTYGESLRAYCTLKTPEGIQAFADKLLEMLRGKRNKGKLKCLLYPKVEIMDWVTFTDSLFPELSGGYYVLDYSFKADEKGYYQEFEVTDRVFAF